MKNPPPFIPLVALWLSLAFVAPPSMPAADWPQWRGPSRNGIANGEAKLPDSLSNETPPAKIWKSGEIPSDHYGGHGSVVVSQGKIFLSVVWHRDVPTDTRTIDADVMAKLGYRGTDFSAEWVARMEQARLTLNPRLRGGKLDEWAENWVKENLDEDQSIRLGSWVISRFKQGKAAFAIADFEKLEPINKQTFANQAALEEWVHSQGFDEAVAKRVLDAVPNTLKVADDVVLCLDEKTGGMLWKYETKGAPTGRTSSSTPAVDGNKVYAALSTHLYCIDTTTGSLLWKAPYPGRQGPASSPLVLNGKVYLQDHPLVAFDSESGKVVWINKDVGGSHQSPAWWQNEEGRVIICNSSNEVVGVDAETGKILWKQPGGGDATPTVSGDYLLVVSRTKGHSLSAFKLSPKAAQPLWAMDFRTLRYGSSPIIFEGHAYHLGSQRHLCVNLESGKVAWERDATSAISSPILADGKLLVYENSGGMLTMLKADPKDYTTLGRTKVGALHCASPAIVGTRLYFRTKDAVECYDLGKPE